MSHRSFSWTTVMPRPRYVMSSASERRRGRRVEPAAGVAGDPFQAAGAHGGVERLAVVGRGAHVGAVAPSRPPGRARTSALISCSPSAGRREAAAGTHRPGPRRSRAGFGISPPRRADDRGVDLASLTPRYRASRTEAVMVHGLAGFHAVTVDAPRTTRFGTPSASQRSSRRHNVSWVVSSRGTSACICQSHESCDGKRHGLAGAVPVVGEHDLRVRRLARPRAAPRRPVSRRDRVHRRERAAGPSIARATPARSRQSG